MKKKRLIWHIYPSYVLLSALAMIAVAVSASRIAHHFHYKRTEHELTNATFLIMGQLKTRPSLDQTSEIDDMCQSLARKTGYRVTVILPSGVVAGDSEKDPTTMDNHGNREEILEAKEKGVGHSKRYSDTLKEEMLYVAMPLTIDGELKGYVRTSLSLATINEALIQLWWKLFWAGLFIACIAVVAAALISRRITRPLERIRLSGESFGKGGQYEKLPSSGISEVDVLTNTLNIMADQLDARIHTIKQQHDEQSALLSCMVESVLAVDAEKNLLRMNQSAEKLFQVDAASSLGKNIMEVIRNVDLLELATSSLTCSDPQEREIYLSGAERYLLGTGSALHGPEGQRIGAVIVVNDITRLRKMERMRRDFIADVSHELNTPITAILGFMDTLCEGAVENTADRERFLEIIHKHSHRLKAIVADLLALSGIEESAEKREIEFTPGHIRTAIQNAVQACQTEATEKNIALEIYCPETLKANINLSLLQQAIINLVHNAVKFSEPDTQVEITGKESDTEIAIQVRDQGPGIAAKHLSRLFERFYRVDDSRSRNLGGTGLGLAIVKHIVLAHSGRVAVESEENKGSTFSIFLPKI